MSADDRARTGPNRRRAWIPPVLADRYEIERELGAGAAAVTVSALDRRLGRRVAVKILKPEDDRDQEFSRRFTREARAAAAINHPNVVSVYDVGEEGDLLYLVMQYVDGTDLKRLIEREGALPWRRAVELARAVLAGLGAIHQVGIVHRDIKPQNVLIGGSGEVKLTDFGVAHMDRDGSLTAVGTTVGTAAYMAPEQAQGETPTPGADLYAVGVMLYEMVTGRVPFEEPTSVATMLAHIQREAAPAVAPRGREPIPAGVAGVIQQAMAKDPRQRFGSAAAMQRALEHPPAPAATGMTTEAVPAIPRARTQPPPQPRPSRRQAAVAPVRPAQPSAGRSFGMTFALALLVLALALAAVAGAMWVMEERPNLFAGSDDSTATAPAPTEPPTAAIETVPVIIVPPEPTPTPTQEPPTPTPTPPPTPTATPEPTPTEPVIVPAQPTQAPVIEEPSGGEQIIEPIDGSTVVPDPQT